MTSSPPESDLPHLAPASEHARASSTAVRFLKVFLADRDADRVRTLEEYQALFPAQPDIVAAEYASVMADEPHADETSPLTYAADGARYREAEVIGRGGMGTVLKVFDPALRRDVAMKRLATPEGLGSDDSTLTRFLEEAAVTGQLQHPGIVSVLEIGKDAEQRPYFTMPLIEGRSLLEVIERVHRGDADWSKLRIIDILVRVCEAVAYAHDRGVVHRDLKPANVMTGQFGETYVVDWGLARSQRNGNSSEHASEPTTLNTQPAELTLDGDVIGTPAYMAPEQARGDRAATGETSDIYSIGAVLYHALTGRAPFLDGDERPDSAATLERVRAGPPRPIRDLAHDTAPELVAICERAMAREPASRYPTVAALGGDLRAFLENRVVQAHATGTFTRIRKWIERNRALACASAIALLALLGGFGWSEAQRRIAVANAHAATENLDLAFSAGEELLGTLGLHGLAGQEGADPMRERMLERALAYYERLRDLRGDDVRVDRHLAEAHYRIAELMTELGRREDAERAWQTARAATETVIAKDGQSDARQFRLDRIDAQQHVRMLQSGDSAGAIQGLQRSLKTIKAWQTKRPNNVDVVHDECGIAYNLTLAMIDTRNRDGAIRASKIALAASRAMLEGWPELPASHAIAGSTSMLRGKLLWQLGDPENARRHYAEGMRILEQALVEFPGHRACRFRLGELFNIDGVLLREQGNPGAAIERFERARTIFQQLVDTNPGVRDYLGAHGGTLANLGILRSLAREYTTALELLTAARTTLDAALAVDGDASDFRQYRDITHRELAIARIEIGRLQEAVVGVREWIEQSPGGNRVAAARLLMVCAERVHPDHDSLEVGSLYDTAAEWLLAAAAQQNLSSESLARSVFAPLREREDIRGLSQRLEKR